MDSNTLKAMKIVMNSIPKRLIEIAKSFNDEINSNDSKLKYIMMTDNKRTAIEILTTKEIQKTLKVALGRIESSNFKEKLKIKEFDTVNIVRFRNNCKNSKLRNTYFRLVHKDFYTYERMKRFKMTTTDKCPRCNLTETTEHLLWECVHVRHIWTLYNDLMINLTKPDERILKYEDIYKVGFSSGIIQIKISLIKELIQIVRPTNWNENKLYNLIKEQIKIDEYISKRYFIPNKCINKWKFLKTNLNLSYYFLE